MTKALSFLFLSLLGPLSVFAQVKVSIDASKQLHTVSPFIYGKNNCFADNNSTAASNSEITRYRDAGLRFVRENSGNNASKYNWRKKLSSHPDWYNNVYQHNWDQEAAFINQRFPNMQIMYGFQLLGKAANNTNNNFGDWNYNQSQWWDGVHQNLAGGGVVNTAGGGDALTEGNPDLYLTDWPADSTTALLHHWFGENGLGFDPLRFQYWSMDNEPEIWSGTHDDVMKEQIKAFEFMELYFDVALKAKAINPNIKLCGPVMANEWQWYKYSDQQLRIDNTYYCWLEYFIKKAADKEKETGIRVLDVVDIHWYPGETADADVVQLHRVFYDEDFNYPGANGVKTINGGWNNNLQNEYILKRIEDWLDKHFGENHGIGIGISEFGANNSKANVNAVLYASILGTFANNGIEFFTPWHWNKGMWEVMHIFSNHAKTSSVESTSDEESQVSAYSTINDSGDSLTVMLVNRSLSATRNTQLSFSNFQLAAGSFETLQVHDLPESETFISATNNAAKSGTVTATTNTIELELPPLSVTALMLSGSKTNIAKEAYMPKIEVYPNPTNELLHICWNHQISKPTEITVINLEGQTIEQRPIHSSESEVMINTERYPSGTYILRLKSDQNIVTEKFIVSKL